jgi:type I restriction enzyme, S subunit
MELRSGYKHTEVGVIPEDWDSVLLDSVAKRGSGHTPDKKHPEYWDGDVKWISLKDSERLDTLYISDSAAKITPAGIANSSATIHPVGTVVLSRDAGVGKSAIMSDEMAVSQHFMAWQCGPRINNIYLYYRLQAQKPEFERIAMGNTIKTIGLPYFKSFQLPLPSIEEQRAIAAALSDVDALIASIDRLIAKKNDVKQATMQDLLTGKRRLPDFSGEWKVKCLGEVGTFSKGKGIRKDEVIPDGIPCIRYGEIYTQHNDYVKSFGSFISPRTAKQSQILCKGDLLFAGSGETAEEIGKCVAFLGDEEAYAGGDIVIFTPTGQDSKYLGYLMNDSTIVKQKSRMGQGDAVVHISARNLAQLELNLPSLPEQAAIATILSDMDADIATMEQKRDKTLMLKQGMMQELLTGRIRLI